MPNGKLQRLPSPKFLKSIIKNFFVNHLLKYLPSLLLFILLMVMTGCNTNTPTSADSQSAVTAAQEERALSFNTLAQEAPLGSEPTTPAYLVNTTAAAWDQTAMQLPPEAIAAAQTAAPSEMVVVAFAGAKASSGYQITITNIEHLAKQLQITVREQQPAADEIVEPAMTLPFHVVTLPTESLPAEITSIRFQNESGTTLAQHSMPPP